MQLKSFKYAEHMDNDSSWELERFDVSLISLFVAKNATGKSRTLNVISALMKLISGDMDVQFTSASWDVEISDDKDVYCYKLDVEEQSIKKELLTLNGKVLIDRNDNNCEMYFAELERTVSTSHSENVLAITRRDKLQHPYLENIINWASNTYKFDFSTSMGREQTVVFIERENKSDIKRLQNVSLGAILKYAIDNFDKQFRDNLRKDMASIGYSILDVELQQLVGQSQNKNNSEMITNIIAIQEEGLSCFTIQNCVSNGMFRALSLLMRLNYLELAKLPTSVIIDDIGEGLDFERSQSLINLIIEKANKNQFQLIMSTNDRFVMNEVSLDYWNILQRENHTCSVVNMANSPKLFENFSFTGLNNFDLLKTEFFKNQEFYH